MALVAVGACYMDTILTFVSFLASRTSTPRVNALKHSCRTPHYPAEDEKQRATSISRRRGETVLQQLIAASYQSLSLHLVSVLPARLSSASQYIISDLEPGVQLKQCIFREASQEPASCYIIKSQATGSRTVVNHNELPEMTVDEFIENVQRLEPCPTWVHFEGRIPEVTRECIRYVQRQFPSASVSVEIERPGRPGLQELAKLANVVFYAKSWALVSIQTPRS
ncbi:pfkB family kinase [Penicillium chermesinum]|uniref:PfkB family kinase n=1 Tax=Penicillium chermesinum TaxID=63820 RepID=A0A9W9P8B7_9EURO|nr:pfkB family kinase [Penicillium chermesinum]KAJ5239396.1 pfkB family kinase [Penicillium chermesinum]